MNATLTHSSTELNPLRCPKTGVPIKAVITGTVLSMAKAPF